MKTKKEKLESGVLSAKNIGNLIKSCKQPADQKGYNGIVLPLTYRGNLDKEKYRGKGRPRINDYKRKFFVDLL